MKKVMLYLGMVVVCLGLFAPNVFAQDTGEAGQAVSYDMPAMKILALKGSAPSLTFVAPANAGAAIAAVTNDSTWINYTSVVDSTSATNKVTVAISGTVPVGTTLTVAAASDAGAGNGTVGSPAGTVTLSSTAQDLITSIGSCYTGDGDGSGHQLTYTWSANSDDYADIVAGSGSDITATYTITAE